MEAEGIQCVTTAVTAEDSVPKTPSPLHSPEASQAVDRDKSSSPNERCSPEPNCAICLGKPENKSFTDSCLHQFCFTCLLEWSKIKAECPLCKQHFKSIIHNVRSNEDYDQYHLYRAGDSFPWTEANGRIHLRNNPTEAIPPQRLPVRQRYSRRRRATEVSNIHFRERVYQDNMWVVPLPDVTGRYRECSPQFYWRNPTQLHRLVPWLNRELSVLMGTTPVAIVLDMIMSLLTSHPVRSHTFRSNVAQFLHTRTEHFIHEFFAYATSPYDMMGFDRTARYGPPPTDTDSDVVVVSPGPSPPPPRVPNTLPYPPIPENSNNIMRFLSQLMATGSDSSDTTVDVVNSTALDSDSDDVVLCPPGPSTARRLSGPGPSGSTHIMDFLSSLQPRDSDSDTTVDVVTNTVPDSDSDDCLIVGIVKPLHERTPEVITLSSEPELVEDSEPGSVNIKVQVDSPPSLSSSFECLSDLDYHPNRQLKQLPSCNWHFRKGSRAETRQASRSSSRSRSRRRNSRSSSRSWRLESDSSPHRSPTPHRSSPDVCHRAKLNRPLSSSSDSLDLKREMWRVMAGSNNEQDGSTLRPRLRSIVITRSPAVAGPSRDSAPPSEPCSSSSTSRHGRYKHKKRKRDSKKKKSKRKRSPTSTTGGHKSRKRKARYSSTSSSS